MSRAARSPYSRRARPDRDEHRSVHSTDTRTSARPPRERERERAAALAAVVEDLGAELSLQPLLERILDRSIDLLGGDAGSICLVDEARRHLPQGGRHRRGLPVRAGVPAERGRDRARSWRGARLGGVRATTRDVPGGHVPAEERASLRGVIGVPDLVAHRRSSARCVVFSRDPPGRSAPRTPSCSSSSPSTRRWPSPTPACTRSAEANARAEAAAEERNRMAREVHDTVAKGLVSVLLHLRAAEADRGGGRAASTSARAGRGARAPPASRSTRPAAASSASRRRRWRGGRWRRRSSASWAGRTARARPTCGWWWPASRCPLPAELAHPLFRIAQEALTNALHHADARLGPDRHRLRRRRDVACWSRTTARASTWPRPSARTPSTGSACAAWPSGRG